MDDPLPPSFVVQDRRLLGLCVHLSVSVSKLHAEFPCKISKHNRDLSRLEISIVYLDS